MLRAAGGHGELIPADRDLNVIEARRSEAETAAALAAPMAVMDTDTRDSGLVDTVESRGE